MLTKQHPPRKWMHSTKVTMLVVLSVENRDWRARRTFDEILAQAWRIHIFYDEFVPNRERAHRKRMQSTKGGDIRWGQLQRTNAHEHSMIVNSRNVDLRSLFWTVPTRGQTYNLWFRTPTPYPLGHTIFAFPFQKIITREGIRSLICHLIRHSKRIKIITYATF